MRMNVAYMTAVVLAWAPIAYAAPFSDPGTAASTASLIAIQDNWIIQDYTGDNFGNDNELEAREENDNDRMSLIQWDLSSVPPGATVTLSRFMLSGTRCWTSICHLSPVTTTGIPFS